MAKSKGGIVNKPPKTSRVGISTKPGGGYSRVPEPKVGGGKK
jgi:hypothetical protein